MPRRAGVIDNAQVAAVFRSYPRGVAAKLRALRRLILEVAAVTEGVGEVQESLRWGQPSYLTARPRSGSTIRIDRVKSRPGRYAMYFHCQTTLVDTFRRHYPSTFRYEGNRAIVFDESDEVPVGALRRCIALALTYHLPRGRKA
jgi:hypothetical protein